MLLPIVYFILLADGIAMHFCGRCYHHLMQYESMLYMAGVIAIYVWQML